jgi:putrescine transport system ATP-binding protein
VWLALRPEKIRMSSDRPKDETNELVGTIHEIGYRGDVSIYKIQLADRSLMKVAVQNASVRKKPRYAVNDLVWLSWPAEAGVVLTR